MFAFREITLPLLCVILLIGPASSQASLAKCKTDRPLPQEGVCLASSAIVIASVATDAWCLDKIEGADKSLSRYEFSVDHILQCCRECRMMPSNTCLGGKLTSILDYMKTTGLVRSKDRSDILMTKFAGLTADTGECFSYYSYTVCKENSWKGCDLPIPPKCPEKCPLDLSNQATILFEKFEFVQLRTISDIERTLESGTTLITEIELYTDILNYKGDYAKKYPYVHSSGQSIGKFTVKLVRIIESMEKYKQKVWVIRTTIGNEIGDNGLISIPYGINLGGIEDSAWKINVPQPLPK